MYVYLGNSRSISRIESTSHSFEVEEVANPGCPSHSSWLSTSSRPLGAWLPCNSIPIKLTSTSSPPQNASDVRSRFLQIIHHECPGLPDMFSMPSTNWLWLHKVSSTCVVLFINMHNRGHEPEVFRISFNLIAFIWIRQKSLQIPVPLWWEWSSLRMYKCQKQRQGILITSKVISDR